MCAGNMGEGAKIALNNVGIEVIRGCTGPVREVAENWLKGVLKDSQIACTAHGDECSTH